MVVAGVHGKEKVRPVAVRSYPGAIDSESRRWRSNVDINIVGQGTADYVYQCLASVRLCRCVLLLVRFHLEVDFLRPATGSCERIRRRILSKNRRSKKQHNQCGPEHSGTSFYLVALHMRRS